MNDHEARQNAYNDEMQARINEYYNKSFPGGVVPEVDPADLDKLWAVKKECEKHRPPPSPPGTVVVFQGPSLLVGTNPLAVFLRLSMVGMLQFIARRTGRTLPEIPTTQDGKPTEAVFKALAALPLTANPRGKRLSSFHLSMWTNCSA
jgi:hypothetical protein